MNKNPIFRAHLLGASALLLMTAVQAQRPAPGGTLERARHLFSQIDGNKDGFLSATEAGRTKIPTRDFVSSDTNRDRKLSSDEFLVFYSKLLVKGGKTVGASLEAEVSRIQAVHRTTEKKSPVKSTPTESKPSKRNESSGGKTDAERAQDARDAITQERIEAARDQKNAENDARAQEAREKLAQDEANRIAVARAQKQAEDAARAAAARSKLADQEATRIAVARAEKKQIDAARAAAARKKLAADTEAARIAAARAQKAQQDAERAAEARRQHERIEKARAKSKQQGEDAGGGGVGMGPGERAQAFVKRLTDAGRLTPQQARDFYDVLLAKASSARSAAKAMALRAALSRAKGRIGSTVRAGYLTAEEGRVLSMALDDRARRALAGPEAGAKINKKDAKRSSGRSGPGAKGVQAHPVKGSDDSGGILGARRKSKPKDAGVRRVGGKGKAGSEGTRGNS